MSGRAVQYMIMINMVIYLNPYKPWIALLVIVIELIWSCT